eukprot:1042755-Rhodomonas_salina.1
MDGAAPNRCAGNDVEEGNVALEDSQSLPQGSVRGASSDAYAFVLSPPCTVHESFQSRRHARLAAVGTAAALLICAVIAGSWDQVQRWWCVFFAGVLSRQLTVASIHRMSRSAFLSTLSCRVPRFLVGCPHACQAMLGTDAACGAARIQPGRACSL